jgi:protein-L-isoaspartate(D-aspartate) O-methyltransferase
VEGIERLRLKGSISAVGLVVLASGLITGFLLGAILPGNLPGMKRGALPSRADPSDISQFMGPSAGIYASDPAAAGSSTMNGAESGGSNLPTSSQYDPAAHLGELPTGSVDAYLAWMRQHTLETPEYLQARWDLSRRFIRSGELQGGAIEAFLKTPRELFVREQNLSRAYDDTYLHIGYGATITDPDVVSMMTTTLDVKPGLRVLEIGTGSGYQSAILSFLTKEVYSIEIIEPLYYETNALYDSLKARYPSFANIHRKLGDGFYGWEKYAPFDRIIVTCSIDHLPPPLIKQLSPNGIMVVPLGPPGRQYIMEVKKTTDADGSIHLTRRDVYNGLSVTFIPFRNEEGRSYSGGQGD